MIMLFLAIAFFIIVGQYYMRFRNEIFIANPNNFYIYFIGILGCYFKNNNLLSASLLLINKLIVSTNIIN